MTVGLPNPQLTEADIARLDAAEDALLAPVRGPDRRKRLPKEYFRRKPVRFLAKFLFALALIGASWAAIALSLHWSVTAVAVVVAGLMFGHLLELQHECLHEHAFRARRLNRICGFISGVPTLSSFWHYKYQHLRHHAFLGTPQNTEFFNYRVRNLDSIRGFLIAAFHLGRYVDLGKDLVRSWAGRPIPRVDRERDQKKIRSEYRLCTVIIAAAVAFTVLTGNLFFVFAWLLPSLLVAEATHFMVEMPEHFGLNTQSDPNVLTNTRTINASRIAQWFTNYNNLHTAHHFHQGVPMAQAVTIHQMIADQVVPVERSYPSFYLKVLRGELNYQNMDETCMNR